MSANHQVTIPRAPFDGAQLEVGDAFRVEARGPGQIALTRTTELARQRAESLFDPERR